ncbi:MAG: hypothetical protein R3A52_11400 [Polyangiales bacterium]
MILSLVITLVSFGFTALMMWKVFLPMMKNAGSLMSSLANDAQLRQRLLATGAEGTARVVGLRETGMLVNHHPQVALDLEVQSPQGHRFMAKCLALVSPMAAPRVQPGCVVPVRFDPANLAHVAVVI